MASASDYYVFDNSDIESKTLEAAKDHYMKGKFNEALKLYLGLLNTNISYKLCFEIGRCYYKLNDFMRAKEYFKKSIGLDSRENSSYLYLGNIAYKEKNLNNAIKNWVEVFAFMPEDEAVCLNLATSYFSKNMKFQSVYYYEKYLKYAQNKNSSYNAISNSINKCYEIGNDFLQKARKEYAYNHKKVTIELLEFATKNLPISFDINFLLGKIYLEEKNYDLSLKYLQQAFCIDFSSLDVLQVLASVYIIKSDFTSAYCTLRRLLPLVINNQIEYLKILKVIKDLNLSFNDNSYQKHLVLAEAYEKENNYHMALIEYENCKILNENLAKEYIDKIETIRSYIMPEDKLIKVYLEKAGTHYINGDYRISNKYFSKVMLISNKNSSEYKLAKSKVIDV